VRRSWRRAAECAVESARPTKAKKKERRKVLSARSAAEPVLASDGTN
jgi:hypothetical protein